MRARPPLPLLSALVATALTVTLAPAALAASAELAPRSVADVGPADISPAGMSAAALADVMGWRRSVAPRTAEVRPVVPVVVAEAEPATLTLTWPMLGEVNSGFGMRWGRQHQGIDMRTPWHTPLRAPAEGTVTFAGWRAGYGVTLEIKHGFDTSTRYAHLAGTPLAVGDRVAQGEWIANTGNTGQSTGPHLHFEVHVGGTPIDPLSVLPAQPTRT
jgi:murein DD-endopeptidase MepM/ murein hydrolase activator NlpD